MTTLTVDQFSRCTGSNLVRATMRLADFTSAMRLYSLDETPQRVVMFLANIGHESGHLAFRTEIWGPTDAQRRYERDLAHAWPPHAGDMVNALAYSLGNSIAGDGARFRGHGELQNTGRAGHVAARDSLRHRFGATVPDFEVEPERLTDGKWSALAAADYIVRRGCVPLMDAGNFDGVCDLVNIGRVTPRVGDSNGYPERKQLAQNGFAAMGLPWPT